MDSSIIRRDDVIGGCWRVIAKIGEGGCGEVYEVKNLQDEQKYAMKVELTGLKRNDQLLKTEALVLMKLQFSQHAPSFLCFDRTSNFRLLVMGLLGNSISDLRHDAPKRRFSMSTVLRIGLQALRAIWDLHRIFIVHRDIKPANFALGLFPNHRRLYLFDFGLARSILDPATTSNERRLRRGREAVAFRGTVAYCSPNVHKGLEQGRHDDLWSMLYMCIELIVGSLPWSRLRRAKAFFVKERIEDKYLLVGCPKKFEILLAYFRSLRYEHRPDYCALCGVFESCIVARHIRDSDPFDWETDSATTSKVCTKLSAKYQINSSDKLMGAKSNLAPSAVFPDEKRLLDVLKRSDSISFSSNDSCSSSTSVSSPTIFSSLSPSRRRRGFRQDDDDLTPRSITPTLVNSTQSSSTRSSTSTSSTTSSPSQSSNQTTATTMRTATNFRVGDDRQNLIRDESTAISSKSNSLAVMRVAD